MDIVGLVVDLFNAQAGRIQDRSVEIGHTRADAAHHLDHIGAGIAQHVEDQRRLAAGADACGRILVAEPDVGNVAQRHPGDPPGGLVLDGAEQHLARRARCGQFALEAHDIAALAFVHLTGRQRDVGALQGRNHCRNGQPVLRHLRRLYDDAQLPCAAAVEIGAGDAFEPLHPFDDEILDEIAIGVDRAVVAIEPGNDEPGDGIVFGALGLDLRALHFVRITDHPVEPVGDQQDGPVHVLADLELQSDPRTAGPGAGHDPLDPFDAFQDIFLAVEDLALDLGRRGAGPSRGDGEVRLADIGRELDRNLL